MSQQTPMVIDFAPTGAVQAMHRENVLNLAFLGKQAIIRATDIRFDTDTQKWGIWPRTPGAEGEQFDPPPCKAATGFDSYESARDAEILWLEQCRLVGVEPSSRQGILVLENFTVPAASAVPDECAANSNGHRVGPHGPGGEPQCEWCGAAPETAAPPRDHGFNSGDLMDAMCRDRAGA